jgi:hypothetical protein
MANYDSRYTPELAEDICEKLATGRSLRDICSEAGMPAESTVRLWAADDRDGFAARYARAREAGYAVMAEEILEISDDATNDFMKRKLADGVEVETFNTEHVQRSRLRVDTRKWLLAKMLPKTYGDKLELGGEVGVKAVPDEQLESRLADLLRKAGTAVSAGGEGAP